MAWGFAIALWPPIAVKGQTLRQDGWIKGTVVCLYVGWLCNSCRECQELECQTNNHLGNQGTR